MLMEMADPVSALPEGAAVDASPRARPSRRSILLRLAALVAIIVVVFVVVLPRLVNYEDVRAAFATLTAGQLAALIGATAVAYALNAGPARVLVPELSSVHAVGADLVGRAVASTIPGPSDVAIKSVLFRQWEVPVESANAGLVLASLFEPLSSLALPLVAIIGVIVTGQTTSPRVLLVTAIGIVALALTTFGLLAVVRSEAMARRAGEWLERSAARVWSWFHRTPPTGIVDGVLAFRSSSGEILSERGVLGFGAAIVAKLGWFVVLELCLSALGVGWGTLPPAAVLAAMAVVGIVALVPITPGAVGVSEVAYIGILSAVTGPDASDAITAAVLLFRVAQWLGPIPIGWLLLVFIRGRRWSELLRGGESEAGLAVPSRR
jgi:putative heme transporter